ncbi:MAG: DNA topoisomerase I [Candidatus Hodarchaeaceae archaeon]|nr:DNA topoisomerase I [Candidatus Hodarchaeaceae archaeon]
MAKTLIVCEKPTAAAKIATALAEKKPKKGELNGVPYYEFERDGKQMVVVPALGHLFTLKNLKPMREYPVYDIDWVPTYKVDRKAKRTEVFVEAIKELAKDATDYISACDYDIEGSVIGYNVLRYLCGPEAVKRAKRMKFSTLTTQDLQRAYEQLMSRLDFELVDAGVARHVLDWYWGMNTSKALSAAVEAAGERFAKLSAGRVQTPALKILVEREREIKAFKPEPFWVLSLLLKLDGVEVVAEHATPRFFDKAEADRALAACKGRPAKVSAIQTRQYRRLPPVPFDLGALQSEAYRCFGYTPMRTQQIAQVLYQEALISYPRTSSQKLPPTIGYDKILKQLGGISKQYKKFADELLSQPELVPNEGKKTDPAHPSIYPTGERPGKLTGPQQRLYDLIVRRFFSVFGKPALVEGVKVELNVGGQPFFIHGRRVLDDGWLKYYGPYGAVEEIILPQLRERQELAIKEVKFEEKETQPPARYNPASIVKELESRNLGTKSTRAAILQNIYERGYIFGSQITVTDLGIEVVDSLLKYCPEIASEELTAEFEREMEEIQEGKRDKEEVIAKARTELDKILSKFKQHQLEIGRQLAESYRITRLKQRTLGKCSKCGGDLRIIISRATRKRFAGCSNYPKCTNSFPLPQVGMIVSLDRTCEQCGAPMIQVSRIGMRPYRMCLDPKCLSKAEWGKKRAVGDNARKIEEE